MNNVKVVKESTVYIRDAQKIDFIKAIVGQVCLCIITVALIGYDGQYFFIIIVITEAIAFLAGASIMKYIGSGLNDRTRQFDKKKS